MKVRVIRPNAVFLLVLAAACLLLPRMPAAAPRSGGSEEDARSRAEQLAYERETRIKLHLGRAERFLSEEDLDSAYEEYEAVLDIVPGDYRAESGIRRIEARRAELDRAEREAAERRQKLEEVEEEIRRELAAQRERDAEAARAREERGRERRRIRDTRRRIDEHLRTGKEFYRQKSFQDAIREWEEVLQITRPGDEEHKRAQGWIEAAKMMEVREKQRVAYMRSLEDEEGMVARVLDTWTYSPPTKRWEERIDEDAPEAVSPEMLRLQEQAEQKISIDVESRHIRDVIRDLSRMTGINIAMDDAVFPRTPLPRPAAEAPAPARPRRPEPEVDEEEWIIEDEERPAAPAAPPPPDVGPDSPYVTIYLVDIPFIEALDAILRTKSLNYRIEDHVIWITTEDKIGLEGEVETRTYRPTGDLRGIVSMLRDVIPFPPARGAVPGSRLVVDEVSRVIFLTHTPSFHQLASDLIRRLSDMTPQISIEAKFIDVSLAELRQIGAQLSGLEPFEGVFTARGKDELRVGDFQLGVSPTAQPRGIFMSYQKFTPTQFRMVMQAFEESRKTSLLSSPKVTVLNDEEARIEVDYSISWVSSYTLEDRTVTRTVGGTTYSLTQSNWVVGETESKAVGVYLRVRPVIGGDRRRINLTLTPVITDFLQWMEVAGTPLRSPVFSVRELQTSVDVNDGETIVLGGLIEGEDLEGIVSVPVLGEMPVVGSLFRRRSVQSEKKELLIFVTAKIIDPTGLPFFAD